MSHQKIRIPVYDSSDVEWTLTASITWGRRATRMDPAEGDEVELLTVGRGSMSMSFDDWSEDNNLTPKQVETIEQRVTDEAMDRNADGREVA